MAGVKPRQMLLTAMTHRHAVVLSCWCRDLMGHDGRATHAHLLDREGVMHLPLLCALYRLAQAVSASRRRAARNAPQGMQGQSVRWTAPRTRVSMLFGIC